jgi:hypothetical protein
MSTLQLTPEHLSAIVWGAQKHNVVSLSLLTAELNELMIELLTHNCREYNDRYPADAIEDKTIAFYEYRKPTNVEKLTAIQLYKLALCYQTNATGSPSWRGSQAEKLTTGLMTQAIISLPEYSTAKWEI